MQGIPWARMGVRRLSADVVSISLGGRERGEVKEWRTGGEDRLAHAFETHELRDGGPKDVEIQYPNS